MKGMFLILFSVAVTLANPFIKEENKMNVERKPIENNMNRPMPPPEFPPPSNIPPFPADIPPPNIAKQEEKPKIYGYINGYTLIEKNKEVMVLANEKCYIIYPNISCDKESGTGKIQEEIKTIKNPKIRTLR